MGFNKRSVRQIAMLILFAVAILWAGNNIDRLSGGIKSIVSIFSPFIVGLCIAFVINVLMQPIERLWTCLWKKRSGIGTKLKRPVCLVLSTMLVLGLVFALLFLILPELKNTVMQFIGMLPDYIRGLEGYWIKIVDFMAARSIELPEISLNENEVGRMISSFLSEYFDSFFNKTIEITTSIFGVVVDLVLAFAFSIYVLAQKEKLGGQLRRMLQAFMPQHKADAVLEFAALTNRTFAGFVTGQLTEALIIGVLCFIGMTIFGMPYALVISLLVCVTALVPIFGAFIGTGIGAVLIFMVNPMQAIWFVVFIIVLQQIEGNLIYPKVVGRSVGLPGIWVLVAVTAGGRMMGITGMLLSVPLCSVLYCLLGRIVRGRLKKKGLEEVQQE